ncbi:L-ascorbate metabolism protein UlaG, beta-lactamase superfamily [Butyrivibrio sp. INlla18]|uniref:MBL fold metallo-hydrolase n=1 Tax=Butyrivibrio sp. INlla18 TaxID=1520806 RepID=UPI00087FB000|nr:MBL fold metallo-hydrolase [Butyrivibrio sp. INlla18]SDA62329.1 L-ascorbate metabolism protein UlaG, beta-lactamase superfamily [Butyrivibrio sp. INlla18]
MIDNIEVFTHSSIRIKSDAGVIYADPFQIKEDYHDADYVLITHHHYDHFSIEDIRKVIKPETILIVPAKMEDDARELSREVKEIVTLRPNEKRNVAGLELEAVPAYNTLKPFHPKRAEWLGYIVITNGKRIYIAGDTGANKDISKVKCDIALLPIGGTYTMDAKRAADLINTIRPEYAIPTHYGNIIGKKTDGKAFAAMVQSPIKVVEKIQYFKG